MLASGRVAVQSLESIVFEIVRETAALKGKPLSYFSSSRRPVRVAVQLDAARRRSRQFVACVAKNPQLDSQSCFALRLLALGVRFKDHRHGAHQLLASNLDFMEHLLQDHGILVPAAPPNDEEDTLDGRPKHERPLRDLSPPTK
eukprot:5167634-Pleurochrysis_carterae.AAC.1